MILPTGARIPAADGMKNPNSFSIIEILLVVVIIGVIAALAVPNFGGTYARVQLRKTANDLAYLMRYAQSQAVVKNRRMRLEFDPSFTKYWLTQEDEAADSQDKEGSFSPLPGRMGAPVAIPEGLIVTSTNPFLVFYPDATLDQVRVDLCRKQECFSVSTHTQRGIINVFETTEQP
ncbi:MAG: GspH/FimT family pseudopilin [Candidatus Omnitrophica bacterium]|nr:GspH/FimT family pseudopilin [Candidatus Omnitrophota bacterium]